MLLLNKRIAIGHILMEIKKIIIRKSMELFEHMLFNDIRPGVSIVSQPSKCLKFMTFREGCFIIYNEMQVLK